MARPTTLMLLVTALLVPLKARAQMLNWEQTAGPRGGGLNAVDWRADRLVAGTNDGVFDVASTSTTVTCPYPVGGVFTVRGRITDKDGGSRDATTTVTVLTPRQAIDAIAAMIGSARELMAKLDQVRRFYEAGQIEKALHHCDVLLHQVELQGNADLAYWIRQLKLSISS